MHQGGVLRPHVRGLSALGEREGRTYNERRGTYTTTIRGKPSALRRLGSSAARALHLPGSKPRRPAERVRV